MSRSKSNYPDSTNQPNSPPSSSSPASATTESPPTNFPPKNSGGARNSLRPISTRLHQCRACQRKVEMSGFSPDRNVRFHGLLQGWFAGTWNLGLFFFLGFFVFSPSPVYPSP